MSELPLPAGPSPGSRRNIAIAGGVVLFHVAALWALNTGLLRRVAEVIVPVSILSEMVTPPEPKVEPPQPLPAPPQPAPKPIERKPVAPPPAPKPIAKAELQPTPAAPTGTVEPQPAPPPVTAPVAAAPAPAAPPPAPAPAKVEPPSSSAEYLQNPKPPYPAASKRLGEQGKVVIRVLIGVDGTAQDAQLKSSSGYERLDNAAMDAVRKWRYVPGKRGGVPEAMWYDASVIFSLE